MSRIDLNLVPVFDALLRHRSVSAAAAELHVTQPAVSNALRRLRLHTGDDLFVRTRRGMEPTPFALSAAAGLRDGLRLIREGIEQQGKFNAGTSRRVFRILMTDAGEMVFLPRILPRLRKEAPGIQIEVMQLPIERYLEALELDQADFAIGNLKATRGAIATRKVFQDIYVIVCRAQHPILRASKPGRVVPFDALMKAEHAVVRPPNVAGSSVDQTFSRNGWTRRIALQVPHYLVLSRIIAETDLVAITPSLVANELARNASLTILEAPFVIPPVTIRIGWHMGKRRDPGSTWLRNLIVEMIQRR